MTPPKLREFLKTLLIFLLIAAALVQTVLVWDAFLVGSGQGSIVERFMGEEMPVYPGQPVYEQISYASDLVVPVSAAVRGADGLWVAETPEEASAAFERAAMVLTQALESAQPPSLVTSARWQEGLSAPMMLWDFGGTVKLSTLAYLMGVNMGESLDGELRWLAAASVNGGVQIFYKSEERGIYAMETGAAPETLEALCRQYGANGGWFGYEKGIAEARNVLLMSAARSFPVLQVSRIAAGMDDAGLDQMIATVLTGFGFNAYTVGSYTESDGSQVYVEGERVLRMTPDGRVSYTDMSPMLSAGEPDVETRAARIGEVSRLAATILAPWLGDAQLYLLQASVDESTGDFVVELGLQLGGVKIITPQGFVLRAAYRGSRLMEADVEMKRYDLTGDTLELLPAPQAMAAAGGASGFGVYYVAGEDGLASPGWYVVE